MWNPQTIREMLNAMLLFHVCWLFIPKKADAVIQTIFAVDSAVVAKIIALWYTVGNWLQSLAHRSKFLFKFPAVLQCFSGQLDW